MSANSSTKIVDDENKLEEDDDQNVANMEQLHMKKQLLKRSSEFLGKLKVSKNKELEKVSKQLEELKAKKTALEEEMKTFRVMGVEEDDVVMNFLADNYADFVNPIAFPETEKPKSTKKKTQVVKEEGVVEQKNPVAIKTMKPADRWALIHVGSIFRVKHKGFLRFYKKTTDGVVECNNAGKLFDNSLIFDGLQKAANSFKLDAEISSQFSGWKYFHLYNPATDMAKSLQMWNGNVEYLNW